VVLNLIKSLDLFPILPIIERNPNHMNPYLTVSLIVVVLISVLIIKDQFSVRMATVRVKK
jgi:hypothetical protein